MELIGSGVDIVDTRRIQKIYTKYSLSFAHKILHDTELAEFHGQRNKSITGLREAQAGKRDRVPEPMRGSLRGA